MSDSVPRILLVDDDADFRMLTSIWLRDAGFVVIEAENGSEAVRQVQASQFNLMLLDLEMPVMDGLETLEQIRNAGSSLPVIIVTSHASMEKQVWKMGISDFICKPVNLKKLVSAVSEFLSRDLDHSQPGVI